MSLILNHLPENVSYCSFLDRPVCCISFKQLYLTSIELETVLDVKTAVLNTCGSAGVSWTGGHRTGICQRWAHPDEAGGKPALLLVDLTPPPVLIRGVQHLDDIAGLEGQLPVSHGHMVPYCLGIHYRAPADQLQKERWSRCRISYRRTTVT